MKKRIDNKIRQGGTKNSRLLTTVSEKGARCFTR